MPSWRCCLERRLLYKFLSALQSLHPGSWHFLDDGTDGATCNLAGLPAHSRNHIS